MNIIAFDVSKHELVGVVVNKRGQARERYVIENSAASIDTFLDNLPVKNPLIGSEATAEYHNLLAVSCIERGIPFKIINPIITKQFTKATVRKRKTDHDDALVIAKCLMQGAGRLAEKCDFGVSRPLLRTADDLVQITNRLEAKERRYREFFPEEQEAPLALKEAVEKLSETVLVLRRLGQRSIDKRKRALLESIPGIGQTLSAVIASEIGRVERFASAKKLSAYAGLDPKVKQSGRGLAHNTRITKRGSDHLRRALFLTASIAQRCDPELKSYYEKKRSEGKRYKEATVANARRIVHRIYAVLKRGTPYERRMLSTT